MTINIHVNDRDRTQGLKAYAEYRVFTSLGPHTGRISAVDVRLSPANTARGLCRWQCAITAFVSGCEPYSIRTAGRFVVEAVDRGAERLAREIGHVLSSEVASVP
jgi:hypothetical protein